MSLPERLPAIAEIGWSPAAVRDWASFRTRIAGIEEPPDLANPGQESDHENDDQPGCAHVRSSFAREYGRAARLISRAPGIVPGP